METKGDIFQLLCKDGEKVVMSYKIPDFSIAEYTSEFEKPLASVIEGEKEYPVYLDDNLQEYRVATRFFLMHPYIEVYESRKLFTTDVVSAMYFH